MLRNYLLIAFRTLRKHQLYSFLNLLGLTVGLASSFFILLWVQDERSVDRFLPEGDRVYRVWRNVHIGGETFTWAATSRPLADVLKNDYPAIEEAVFSMGAGFVVSHGDQSFREVGNYASEAFFQVFQLPFLQGSPQAALAGESSVVITDRLARKLFGDDWQQRGNVVGQSLNLDHRKDFMITGVIEDLPATSSYQSDLVLPIQDFFVGKEQYEQWGNNSFPIYVKLREGASPEEVSDQIAQVVNQHEEGANEELFLQPYEDLYLHSDYENGQLVGGRIEYVRIFAVVAIFLLLIAAINFMNLATARSAQRAREIGVRKAIGAHRSSLIGQFLGESVLLAFVALGFALVLVSVLLPLFNDLTGKQIHADALTGWFLPAALAITLIVGLLAGSYPAFYLSSFRPLRVLRGTFRQQAGAVALRKGLVVFQFGISVLLIVATATVYLQLHHILSKDLGLERNNLVFLPREGALYEKYETFRQELLKQPGIAGVTTTSSSPLSIHSSTGSATWEGKDPEAEYEVSVIRTDYDFVETMRMRLVAGRAFSREFTSEEPGFLVNETMAALMGDGEVVGKPLSFWGMSGTVIGVVHDFDMNSVYSSIEPVIIALMPDYTSQVFVRTQPGRTTEGLASLERLFTQFNPGYPLHYTFVNDDFEATYRSEVVMGSLANVFAIIAIFISCLGLFGLVAFTAEQRTKEIGIRKVMGASVLSIVTLFSTEFLKLVLVAFVLAIPVAWYAMHRWLDDFTYRIDLSWWIFGLAGGAALLIALLTVSVESIKSALANPVKSLRSE